MATFNNLNITGIYNIVSGETGNTITEGIQGAEALNEVWEKGARAYDAEFMIWLERHYWDGDIVEINEAAWLNGEAGLVEIAE